MIRRLSRYHPRYIRSLVYMLQASEYDIGHFLKWHERVTDFRNVEKRKHVIFTGKALALYAAGWLMIVFICALAVLSLFTLATPWNYLAFAVLLYEIPFFIVSGVLIALLKLRIVQIPVEKVLMSQAKRKLAAHKAIKIAVAGSYGKTSMREILKTILGAGKKVAAPSGSHNTPLGIAQFVKSLKGDEEVLIFELGEYYPGDIRKLCEMVEPGIGIITGVNEAHLEKFGTLDKTAATIFELADFLTAVHYSSILQNARMIYVNGENDTARGEAREGHMLYSREGVEGWGVESAKTGLDGTSFTLVKGDARVNAHSKLLGLHHVGALAVAANIATSLGLTPQQIEMGIGETKPFDHRLEPKTDSSGVTTLDDSYNGNPDGVKAVIDFLASLVGRKRWYVTPGLVEMGARKEAVHKEIGRQLAKAGIEKVVLIRNSVTLYIEQGLKESGYKGEIIWFDDGLSVYAALPHMTVKGDVVLLQNDWPDQYQ